MDDQYAKPGDVVEVTWDDQEWKGLRYEVIEYPPEGTAESRPGDAWGRRKKNNTPFVIREGYYTIVERANPLTAQSKDVDESLKRQLNDNLRGLFGFD